MKKSLLLLMFTFATVGFDACAMMDEDNPGSGQQGGSDSEVDPTIWNHRKGGHILSNQDEFYSHPFFIQKELLPEGGQRVFLAHVFSNDRKWHFVKITYTETDNARYYGVYKKDILYCNHDGSTTYGRVFNADSDEMVLPVFEVSSVDSDPEIGSGDDNKGNDNEDQSISKKVVQQQGSSYTRTAYGLITSRPVIITTVSAATAGAAYAITKFINDKWNKQYPAKKIATATGIGFGIITGVYLYWPTIGEVLSTITSGHFRWSNTETGEW